MVFGQGQKAYTLHLNSCCAVGCSDLDIFHNSGEFNYGEFNCKKPEDYIPQKLSGCMCLI